MVLAFVSARLRRAGSPSRIASHAERTRTGQARRELLGAGTAPLALRCRFSLTCHGTLFLRNSCDLEIDSPPAGLALGLALSTPPAEAAKQVMGVNMLSTFERADQRNEVMVRTETELRKVLTKADAPKALRLVLNDAGTYDAATRTGGLDGSIVLSKEELSRPENAGLSELVKRIGEAKAVIDEGNVAFGSGPLSWADAITLAAKCAVLAEWRDIKLARAAIPSGGDTIVKAFGAQWDVRIGRIDSAVPGPAGRVPPPGADTETARKFMLQLGAKPGESGPFTPKPPFWERPAFLVWTAAQDDPAAAEAKLAADNPEFAKWKFFYDNERKTITRTTYEVDFITQFTKLTTLGVRFDADAYLHQIETNMRLN